MFAPIPKGFYYKSDQEDNTENDPDWLPEEDGLCPVRSLNMLIISIPKTEI